MFLANDLKNFVQGDLSVSLELDILGFEINPISEGRAFDNSDVAVMDEHLCNLICSEIFLEL